MLTKVLCIRKGIPILKVGAFYYMTRSDEVTFYTILNLSKSTLIFLSEDECNTYFRSVEDHRETQLNKILL